MSLRFRSIVVSTFLVGFVLTACRQTQAPVTSSLPPAAPAEQPLAPAPAQQQETTQTQPDQGVTVEVEQKPGKTVYWVLPGKRRLGEEEWGTPEHPKALLEPVMEEAKQLPSPLNRTVPQLLKDLPILGGLPLEAREMNADGTQFTTTKGPTAVSDQGRIVTGTFHVTYSDRQPYDLPDSLMDTEDKVDATVQFTDPDGNQYELVVDKLWQPPIPGWETGGGVVTNAWLHGTTGTDSPLFPRVFTWGAFWGLGKVIVNGTVVNENQWIHFMTTQVVRDKNYRLATQDELPLALDDTIAGQVHHTHVIVRPVKWTADGPVFEPVHTAFTLPNGQKQPFLHIMFEQDTILQGAFKDWAPPAPAESARPVPEGSKSIVVEGSEFSFHPDAITVEERKEVTIVFKNRGTLAHNLTIGDLGIKTDTIQPGESAQITFTPIKTGTFQFWCSVSGHREVGMEGALKIEK